MRFNKNAIHALALGDGIDTAFKCSGKMESGKPLKSSGKWDYSVGGTNGAFLYLKDYSNILTAGHTGNVAVA
ncbi:hypothetical protein QHA26_005287 [Escherichia coli]|uniref:hypothetical protein n=1 Tax=Escherichia TaxID=561 RepID=UPI0011E86A60|nr:MULTISPECIES: hypothetical protein [Escherichia]EGO8678910.1 hypothetical protein [Escherichia coli]EGO8705669.1 hypothetical protein [Escherichia coli]EJD8037679.1 hypothetical protein [Escherichia coli]EJE2975391.1 hypothetical protein [Escherichia coli]EJE6846397.1 hypothetical protein [Escherichia coli]